MFKILERGRGREGISKKTFILTKKTRRSGYDVRDVIVSVSCIHFSFESRGGRGREHKVPALISKICIFATNTATATKFRDFS